MFDKDQIEVYNGSPLTPVNTAKRAIILGKQGEEGGQVIFHIEAFEKAYGPGETRLIALRPTEDFIYPPTYVTEVVDSGRIDEFTGHRELTWNISAYDTALYGLGRVEVQYLPYKTNLHTDPSTGEQWIEYWDTVKKNWVKHDLVFDPITGEIYPEYKGLLGTNKFKTVTYPTQIFESFVEGEPPEQAASWIDEILKLKTEIEVLEEEIKSFSSILEGIAESFLEEHPGAEITDENIKYWFDDKWAKLYGKQDKLVDEGDTRNIKAIRVNEGTSSEHIYSLLKDVETEPYVDLEIASDSYYLEQEISNPQVIKLMKKPLKGEPVPVTRIVTVDTNITYTLEGFTKSATKGKYQVILKGSDGNNYYANLDINADLKDLDDKIKNIYDIQGTTETGVLMNKVNLLKSELVSKTDAKITLNGTDYEYDSLTDKWNLGTIEHPVEDVEVDGVSVVDVTDKVAKINLNYKADKTYADEIKAEADKNKDDIADINKVIPSDATTDNYLTTKDFVNSSIETATAKFKGTHTDLNELYAQVGDANDYAIYQHTDALGNTIYSKYVHDESKGTSGSAHWKWAYDINNTGFTDAQWKAINSGANEVKIGQITLNKNEIELLRTLLTKETTDRQTGDINVKTELNTKIDNAVATERTRAEGKESDLQTQIDNKLDATNTITINKLKKKLGDNPIFDEYVTDIILRHNSLNGEVEESIVSETTTAGKRNAKVSTDQILQYIRINDVNYDSTYNGWKLSLGYVIPSNEPPKAETRLPDIYCWYNGDASPVLHGTLTPEEGAKNGLTYLIPTRLVRPWLGEPETKPYDDWKCDIDEIEFIECIAKFDPNTGQYTWVEFGANIGDGGGGTTPNIKGLQLSDKHDSLKAVITADTETKVAHLGMTFTNANENEDLDNGFLELKFFDVVPDPEP